MTPKTIVWQMVGPPGFDAPVWVSVKKLERLWKSSGEDYIGPGGTIKAIKGRYSRIETWILSGRPLQMPQITFGEDGQLSFIDGRHRTAWLRDHGALSIQVQLDPDYVLHAESLLGTEIQITEYYR